MNWRFWRRRPPSLPLAQVPQLEPEFEGIDVNRISAWLSDRGARRTDYCDSKHMFWTVNYRWGFQYHVGRRGRVEAEVFVYVHDGHVKSYSKRVRTTDQAFRELRNAQSFHDAGREALREAGFELRP